MSRLRITTAPAVNEPTRRVSNPDWRVPRAQRIKVYTVLVASAIEGCSKAELTLKLMSATTDGGHY